MHFADPPYGTFDDGSRAVFMAVDGRDGLLYGVVDVKKLKVEEGTWRGGVRDVAWWSLGRGEGWEGKLSIVHLVMFGILIHLDTACDL